MSKVLRLRNLELEQVVRMRPGRHGSLKFLCTDWQSGSYNKRHGLCIIWTSVLICCRTILLDYSTNSLQMLSWIFPRWSWMEPVLIPPPLHPISPLAFLAFLIADGLVPSAAAGPGPYNHNARNQSMYPGMNLLLSFPNLVRASFVLSLSHSAVSRTQVATFTY